MAKQFRRVIGVFVALIAVVAIAFYSVPSSAYLDLLQANVVPQLRRQGVELSWESGRVYAFGIKLVQTKVTISRAFVTLGFDSCEARVRTLSLVTATPKAHLICNGYGGTVALQASFTLAGEMTAMSFQAQGLQLAKHPQLAGLGIESGTLEANAPALQFNNGAVRGRAMVALKGVNKPGDTQLPPQLTRLPMMVVIPSISDLNLSLPATLNGHQAIIQGIEMTSSLGEISGDAEADRDRLKGSFVVSLLPDGKRILGPWLPVISGGALTPESGRFTANLSGSKRAPRLTIAKPG